MHFLLNSQNNPPNELQVMFKLIINVPATDIYRNMEKYFSFKIINQKYNVNNFLISTLIKHKHGMRKITNNSGEQFRIPKIQNLCNPFFQNLLS